MQRVKLAVLAIILVLFKNIFLYKNKGKIITNVSQITQDDCYLCGKNDNGNMSEYNKIDSIGIINFNTWEITNLELNIYEEDGKLIEHCGYSSMKRCVGKNGNSGASILTMIDRKLSIITVYLNKYSSIDRKKLVNLLCGSCIKNVIGEEELEDNRKLNIGIVDFKTNQVYSFDKEYRFFLFGTTAF